MDLFIDGKKHLVDGYYDYVKKNYLDIYNDKIFNARRNLVNKGYFDIIINSLNDILKENGILNKLLLDAGCGECSILERLLENDKYGVDLSKTAILNAHQIYPDIKLGIADLNKLPFEDESFNCITNVFSPKNYGEFARVLKKQGIFIKVLPGNLFDEENKYVKASYDKTVAEIEEYFEIIESFFVEQEIKPKAEDKEDLKNISVELWNYEGVEEIDHESQSSFIVCRKKNKN